MDAPDVLALEAPPAPETAMSPGKPGTRKAVLERIRALHGEHGGLSRVHRTNPALYAQARRAFGSWRAAVGAAGLDYAHETNESLRRGLSLRDQRRALWHAVARFLVDQPVADDATLAAARPELARRVRKCWGSLEAARIWATANRSRNPAA